MSTKTISREQLVHGDLYRQAHQTTIGQGELVLTGSLLDLLDYNGDDADQYESAVYRQIGTDEDAYGQLVSSG